MIPDQGLQVIKQEWPEQWPTFIAELCDSSRTSLSLCENNMQILKLLSEEIFKYSNSSFSSSFHSSSSVTSRKLRQLRKKMREEFRTILALCIEVLREAQKTSLLRVTMEVVEAFCHTSPATETAGMDSLETLLWEMGIVEVLVTKASLLSVLRSVIF
jgi:exportin-1